MTTKNTNTTPATQGGSPDAMAALRAQLSQSQANYTFFKEGMALEEVTDKPVNFVVAKNGTFRVTATPVAFFCSRLSTPQQGATPIPGLQDLKEGTTLRIPKIPFEHWVKVLSFYRDVHAKDKTEASVLFFWNHNNIEIPPAYDNGAEIKGVEEDGQFIIYCPVQKNSSSLSDFQADSMVAWLRQHTTPLLETHSHHTMDAFWSGTDNANENMTQFYGVYGKILDAKPKFLFRYVNGSDKTNIDHFELFESPVVHSVAHVQIGSTVIEIPQEFKFDGPWPKLEYPEDWMGQHTASYAAYTYPRGGAAGATGGAYGSTYKGKGANYQDETADWWYDEYYNPGAGHWRNQGAAKGSAVIPLDDKKKVGDADGRTSLEIHKKQFETETSVVEIVSMQVIPESTQELLEAFCKDFSDSAYDQFVYRTMQRAHEVQ